MFRLPTVAGGQMDAMTTGFDKKQMGVGMTAMAVNAAPPGGMRVIAAIGVDVTVSANHMFQCRLVSRHPLMPVRREHEVRDGYQH